MLPATATRPAASSPLDAYLRDLRDDSLLTAADERSLAEAIAAGDADARARLIRCNLRLVIRIARDYQGRGLALDDLVGEGNLGLIRAAEEFDPSYGVRFSTYAAHWIKQAIRAALTDTGATIRLPSHMVGLLSKWRKVERDLRRECGEDPSFDEVADALGLSDSQRDLVERARRARRLVREESGEGSFDESNSWHDEAAAPVAPPEAALEADEERRLLFRRLAERLDERERSILTLRFGLGGQAPLTLKEVGARLGVTREWVRKIEAKAVRKLDDGEAAGPVPAPAHRRARRVALKTA